jgi:hypothetical protein
VTARIAKGKRVKPRTPREKAERIKARLSKANGICTLFDVQNTLKMRHRSELVLGVLPSGGPFPIKEDLPEHLWTIFSEKSPGFCQS